MHGPILTTCQINKPLADFPKVLTKLCRLCSYSVEKIRHSKTTFEIWNVALTLGPLVNVVCNYVR